MRIGAFGWVLGLLSGVFRNLDENASLRTTPVKLTLAFRKIDKFAFLRNGRYNVGNNQGDFVWRKFGELI